MGSRRLPSKLPGNPGGRGHFLIFGRHGTWYVYETSEKLTTGIIGARLGEARVRQWNETTPTDTTCER
jgi:hypothetical protein